jgi:Uma2 family endonuclease
VVAQREPKRLTIEELRELERVNQDVKYEYIDGLVYLMSG